MRSHEHAARIRETDVADEAVQKTDDSLLTLINSSQKIWQRLIDQSFEESDEGHVELRVIANQTEGEHVDHVEGIEVVFIDQESKTKLGSLKRAYEGKKRFAVARANSNSYSDGELIDKNSPYWDSIVGTITRALHKCTVNASATEPTE